MPDQTWKAEERRVAKIFRTTRALMKGTDEKSDIIHPLFEVDVKLRKNWRVLTWFTDLKKSARKKGKIPVLTLRCPGQKLRLAVVKLDNLISLMRGAGVLDMDEESEGEKALEKGARLRASKKGRNPTLEGVRAFNKAYDTWGAKTFGREEFCDAEGKLKEEEKNG